MANPLTEDTGLIKIHSVCVKMNAVWRPTPAHDLGVDGQIEFLKAGRFESTGDILAVQCKSGPSYFKSQDDCHVFFYPEPKHRRYWGMLRLPVVLILHNPDDDVTLYATVKPQLADGQRLQLNKGNVFGPDCREALLRISQDETVSFDAGKMLAKFTEIRLSRGHDQTITGIDFLLACTNRTEEYFELRMCRITALFELLARPHGISISQSDYDFILRNTLEIAAGRLTEEFVDVFNTQWFDLEVVPDLIVPLTDRGKEVVQHLWANLNEFFSALAYKDLGTLSALELAELISTVSQKESERLDRSDRLGIVAR